LSAFKQQESMHHVFYLCVLFSEKEQKELNKFAGYYTLKQSK